MKNFSATLDLGKFDCCAIRRGSNEIEFIFWMKQEQGQVEASMTTTYRLVGPLFYPANRDQLRREAVKALTLVQQTMLAHPAALNAGERVIVENPELES